MSRFLVLAILVSAFVAFGSTGTIMAATKAEDASILIKCSTCGVGFTSNLAAEKHIKIHPEHKITTPTHPLIKCSTCGSEFTSHVGLRDNLQTNPDHQKGSLVKCSTCGVEFTSPDL